MVKTITEIIDVNEFIKERFVLKIKIKGIVILKVRFFLGTMLLKIAAWVIGCGIDIETELPPTLPGE